MAPATKSVYRRAYQNFLKFHNAFYPHRKVFPIHHLKVAHFIAFSLHTGLKGSSIQTQIAGLNYMHRMMGYPNITDNFIIKKLLSSAQKITHSSDKRMPITLSILKALPKALAYIVPTYYDRVLYNAMFLTAFFALLRVGELTTTQYGSTNTIQFQDVQLVKTKGNLSHIILNIQQHKHSQGIPIPITLTRQKDSNLCPVLAISNYMSIRGPKIGPLFITKEGFPLRSQQFAAILKECITSLGLDPQKYTSHAFRIGGASYADQQNFSETQLKRLGRWNSSAYSKYIRGPVLTLDCTSKQVKK